MITIRTAAAQIRPEIHHLPEAIPTITAGIVKSMGGTIRLVKMRIERYFGESRCHSYAGGANSSSIATFRLRVASMLAGQGQRGGGPRTGKVRGRSHQLV